MYYFIIENILRYYNYSILLFVKKKSITIYMINYLITL
jgi:hypothetical protein